MAVAYLLLGSNIGESKEHLQNAKKYIQDCIGDIEVQSSIYATAAWGNKEQADFLNQVIKIETTLSPVDTLEKILNIELKMGRIRTEKNAARIIDIDILFFSNEIIKQDKVKQEVIDDENIKPSRKCKNKEYKEEGVVEIE